MPVEASDDAQRSPQAPRDTGRKPLTREEILRTGLRLVDQEGLESLTMRKLAQILRVDPMTIYRHVENKEALLSGLAEALWAEVKVSDTPNWEAILASLARSLRNLAHAHPHAYILLCQPPTLPTAMLGLCDGALRRLQEAGFERKRAAEILNTVGAYAIGYALMELAALPLNAPTTPTQPKASDFERIAQVMRALPRETPPHLAEVAYLLCVDCDLGAQFAFGLDLLLTGLRARLLQR